MWIGEEGGRQKKGRLHAYGRLKRKQARRPAGSNLKRIKGGAKKFRSTPDRKNSEAVDGVRITDAGREEARGGVALGVI